MKQLRSTWADVQRCGATLLVGGALAVGVCGWVPPAGAAPEVTAAAEAAQRDLEASLRELAAVRDAIAAEKIPLHQELTHLEDQLRERRKEYDRIQRLQDMRHLDVVNLQNEIKLRQEEANYIGQLLDEYARGFESRLHVSELPRYAAVVEAAKLAPQQTDWSLAEKFQHQNALLKATVARLREQIGGTRFAGTAVDPQGLLTHGQFAMVGPVVLFAADNGQASGVAVPQSGSSQPAVRPLEKKLNVGLAGVVASGEGILPVDPTRGDALRSLMSRGSLVYYFKKGGPIMWPLLLASIIAVTVIIERLWFLARERRLRDPEAVDGIFAAVERGAIEDAIKIGKNSQDFVARTLTYALMHREKSLQNALLRAAGQELHRFTRAIPLLDTMVTLAPLLGLLGTVTGMMSSFGMLGGAELGAPAAITGGIAEALIATCYGLGIACACLLPMNYLHTQADNARHELEDASALLELCVKTAADAARRSQEQPV
jgi:biopolymer transport protein ExbB